MKLDFIVALTQTIVLIVGGYQFYFWCQRRTHTRARSFDFKVDHAIPLMPAWVWIYSGLYYPAIVFAVMIQRDFRAFSYMAFSYFVLLGFQMIIFLTFPVQVPVEWREPVMRSESLSGRFLAFVHSFDARSNCFPSMHVSVATLTALHVTRTVPAAAYLSVLFVALIALSCIFTKQHYLMDLPGAVILGWVSFLIFMNVV